MMHWDGDGGGNGWVVTMVLMMLLLWGSIGALLWYGIHALLHRDSRPAAEDPRAILDARLAHGDIEPEEYERRLELIGSGR